MRDQKNIRPEYLIIPSAGLGTRMRPINPEVPKEMLPLGNKPVIQYAIEEGLHADIKNFVIIINKNKEIIRRYLEDIYFAKKIFPDASEDLDRMHAECTITFLYQKKLKGECDAISYASNIINNKPVAIIYPDNIYLPAPGALKMLLPVFEKYSKDVIALSAVTEEISSTISNAGRVDIEHMEDNIYRIQRFIPKKPGHFVPRFSHELRSCGIYISGPHIFKYIEKLRNTITEGELTDYPVRMAILEEIGVLGYHLPGMVFDVGNPKGYGLCLKHVNTDYSW